MREPSEPRESSTGAAPPVRVLLADGESGFAGAAAEALERGDERVDATAVEAPDAALDALSTAAFDCVVSAYETSGIDGVELLETVHDRHGGVPFVLFTDEGSEAVASEAISAGVDEYLRRGETGDEYERLAAAVDEVVSSTRSERRTADHFERISDAFCEVDDDWRVRYLNDRVVDLIDLDADEVVGERLWDAFPGTAASDAEATLREAAETGEPVRFEERVDRLDADLVVNAYPTDGGMALYVQDMTERRERERDLRELERYRRIVDELPESVCVYDADGGFALVNDHLADVYDASPEKLAGERSRLVERIRAESDAGDASADLFDALVDGERESLTGTTELDLPTKSNAIVDYVLTRLVIDGEFDGILGISREVTDERRRQRRLEHTSARLEALFERSPDMIDIHDEVGEIVDANRAMTTELGYDLDEVVGMDVWEVDDELDPEEGKRLWDELEMDETVRLETSFARADGSTFPVEVHIRRIDVQGEDRFLASSRDISERRAYERRIERENERLDEFASIVSHDLRNPLNVFSGYLRLARETGTDSYFDRCERALDEMERLIDDVLALAKQGETVGSFERVHLGELTAAYGDEAFESAGDDPFGTAEDAGDAAGAPIEIAVEADREILADPGRVRQLLGNLFRNADEHGGERVVVGDLSEGFYVADDGPGIDPDERETVFESGHTTSETGTGFGLAIVQRIAEAHGWEVVVTEGDDDGARFEFVGVDRPESVAAADERHKSAPTADERPD